jgi:hypothetical protein
MGDPAVADEGAWREVARLLLAFVLGEVSAEEASARITEAGTLSLPEEGARLARVVDYARSVEAMRRERTTFVHSSNNALAGVLANLDYLQDALAGERADAPFLEDRSPEERAVVLESLRHALLASKKLRSILKGESEARA